MTVRVGQAAQAPDFPSAARQALTNTQLRHNVRHATNVIRTKRARVVEEMPDWQQLRESGHQIKEHTLRHLDTYLEQFEAACTRAGGHVHWARDADEANRIIIEIIQSHHEKEVIKVKTMTSDEIQLNPALEAVGIAPYETDLADLIVQLGDDQPSHIVAPALHRNRMEVRQIFLDKMKLTELGDQPQDLTNAARHYLREKFLRVKVGISGANFAIAETGAVCVVESEGNGRMCLTLPQILISLIGIEKIIPKFADLEVFFQLLPRSATGERMNPYTSLWTGVTPGDGPQKFHVVLLDNGRSSILSIPKQRQTLKCIRCAACMNACPVYRQTGGHAYGSVYPGPIGAILTPQLMQMHHAQTLPFASSLCGACYEVCPVKINIPEVLLELRSQVVNQERREAGRLFDPMYLGLRIANLIFSRAWIFHTAQFLGRIGLGVFTRKDGWIHSLPSVGGKWTQTRDLRGLPKQPFHSWWAARQKEAR